MKSGRFAAGFPTETIREGSVKVLVPRLAAFVKSPSDYAPSKAPVFYNPVMELNRDLGVLALQVHQMMLGREMGVCEPLTGCGLRAIRYAKEITGVKEVLANDINANAFRLAKHNIQINRLGGRVRVKNEDANRLLACHSAPRTRFDAVDIDPFGDPVPHLDASVRALRDGGLLALTATDMAPLCGVHPRACLRKYGGRPLRTEYCHELAVRLLIGCLAVTAAKYDIGVAPVFSHSANHYVRTYATMAYGAKKADESVEEMGYVLHCFKCFHREAVRTSLVLGHSGKCSECNSKLSFAGPLWIGKISDEKFCESMGEENRLRHFRLFRRIGKILELAKKDGEAPITYYVIDKMCDLINSPVPSLGKVMESLRSDGFKTYLTHFNSKAVRSDASAMKIRQVIMMLSR
jgi:tRNA (guanine26-N2/guanine27-N2)-dimethyltransferase